MRAVPPQFARYNAALRQWPEEVFAELKAAGNLFATTIHVLVSAIIKLSRQTKFPEGTRLYRGIGGRIALPARFCRADPQGRKGYVELGFMSTTSDRATALQYSGVNEARPAPTVLVIEVQALDRGASIKEFSQYPGEEEVLFIPMSFLASDGAGQLEVTANGVVNVVGVRVNINLSASTVEELVERKKRGHLASFRFLISDLGLALRRIAEEGGAEERLSRDGSKDAKRDTVEGLMKRVLGLVEEVRDSHEGTAADQYTNDAEYKALVTEMLDAGAMAANVLRLYLEDPSRFIIYIMDMTLLDAHRALVSFRARAMLPLEGEERRAAALRLCQQKGLVVERVDEASRAGESPLVRAVADGTVGPSAITLLIEAGADVMDGKALCAAAEHGQQEAVAALITAKAVVDSIAVKVLAMGERVCLVLS